MDDDQHVVQDDERPEKRQKLGEQHPAAEQDAEGPPPPPPSQQISQALAKIANHIGNSSKFSKASQLLRQLMDAIDKAHRNEFFHAIVCAFTTPDHCIDPLLRKDYVRLLKAVNIRCEVLSKQQRAQLEVYNTWGLLRNELFTDDSFMYNKVLGKIKAAINHLSDADDEQEAAWAALYSGGGSSTHEQHKEQQQQQQPVRTAIAPPPTGAGAAAEDESDPFGLNEFLAREEAAAAAAARESEEAAVAAAAAAAEPMSGASEGAAVAACGSSFRSSGWDPVSIEVMKKQALLDCIITAKTHQHKLAWARTSIEILIEEVAKPGMQGGFADRFVGGQKQQLQELLKFVHSERAARKSGVNRRPGGKGTGEYMTSFERARAEWSSASWVSTRGKVGSAGDAKANNWLG